MAGSYRHITDHNNNFIGIDLIDNLGDAHEALEECYHIIKNLSGDKYRDRIFEAWKKYILDTYPDCDKSVMKFSRFWEE